MPNNTTARIVRPALRAAGLENKIERVTTGRNCTYVRLIWDDDRSTRERTAEAVMTALRPLWNDGDQRVWLVYSGMVAITRKGWYRTEPAAAPAMPAPVSEYRRTRLDTGITELGQCDPELARAYQEMIESIDSRSQLTPARAVILSRALDTILLKDGEEVDVAANPEGWDSVEGGVIWSPPN